ncbi:MAG: T9SS type A sorting domain-containing protein, partial [Bacteroidetes bacterium]|nr:T9SS type A sorting domain-containing protein [Bacteroidota bacterium]
VFTMLLFVTITAQVKITANDGTVGDCFGSTLSVYGDYAIIGADMADDNGNNSGSAYVFKKIGGNWKQQAKLTPDDGAEGDWFGVSAMYKDYVIIGAAGKGSGAAYIFKRTGTNWVQEAKLTLDDGFKGGWFGHALAIEGEYAIVGAYMDHANGEKSGLAYVFKRTGTDWVQEAKLTSKGGVAGDRFGNDISISGEYAAITAPANNKGNGAVYVFKRTGTNWIQEAKITAPLEPNTGVFGVDVSIHEDYLVVGAPGPTAYIYGCAYIFKRTGTNWTKEAKLSLEKFEAGEWFARSVSIYGDCAIIGAEREDDKSGGESGSAYVFRKKDNSWGQGPRLTCKSGSEANCFGHALAVYDCNLVIGAYGDDCGSVHAYDLRYDIPTYDSLTYYLPADNSVSFENDLFSIYPNPAKNSLRITNPWESKIGYVALYDQSGKKLLQKQLTNNILDISKYSAGIYFLEAKIGDKKTVEKIIIQ